MCQDLKRHLNKLQIRATLFVVAMMLTFLLLCFGILFLFVSFVVSIILFAVCAASISYLVYLSHVTKKEETQANQTPVVLCRNSSIPFDNLVRRFEELAQETLSLSADVRFFRSNMRSHNGFLLRVILYRTDLFEKEAFDRAKARMNKKANKEFGISQWVNRAEALNHMRFNVIYTDTYNEALRSLLSQNANRNLTRVEGIIHIAIIGNQIIIPPLYGACTLAEVGRYRRTIAFIEQYLYTKQ